MLEVLKQTLTYNSGVFPIHFHIQLISYLFLDIEDQNTFILENAQILLLFFFQFCPSFIYFHDIFKAVLWHTVLWSPRDSVLHTIFCHLFQSITFT